MEVKMMNGRGWVVCMVLALSMVAGCREREPEPFAGPSQVEIAPEDVAPGADGVSVRRGGQKVTVGAGAIAARDEDGDAVRIGPDGIAIRRTDPRRSEIDVGAGGEPAGSAIAARDEGVEREVRVGSVHARRGADGDRDVRVGGVRAHHGADGERDVRVGNVHVQRGADGRRRVQVGGLVIQR